MFKMEVALGFYNISWHASALFSRRGRTDAMVLVATILRCKKCEGMQVLLMNSINKDNILYILASLHLLLSL